MNRVFTADDLKESGKVVIGNDAAKLYDVGDGVACFLIQTPNGSISTGVSALLAQTLDYVEREFAGMILASSSKNFSVGADIKEMSSLELKESEKEAFKLNSKAFHDSMMRLKYFSKPIVAAPYRLTLGGGAELVMHTSGSRSAKQLNMGLVEVGVGLIPGGGGCTELLLRQTGDVPLDADLTPLVWRVFETIANQKVSMSAEEAVSFGLLKISDQISEDAHTQLAEAKADVLLLAKNYCSPSSSRKYRVGGRALFSTMSSAIEERFETGEITAYDKIIFNKLAFILTGGDVQSDTEVSEADLLALERDAFADLLADARTIARIEHLLKTGKKLHN